MLSNINIDNWDGVSKQYKHARRIIFCEKMGIDSPDDIDSYDESALHLSVTNDAMELPSSVARILPKDNKQVGTFFRPVFHQRHSDVVREACELSRLGACAPQKVTMEGALHLDPINSVELVMLAAIHSAYCRMGYENSVLCVRRGFVRILRKLNIPVCEASEEIDCLGVRKVYLINHEQTVLSLREHHKAWWDVLAEDVLAEPVSIPA
jgi:hypothetical protein